MWFEQRTVAKQAKGADLLHTPYLGPPLFPPCPQVVTVHDLIMLALPEHLGPPLYRLYTMLAIAGAKKAKMIFADSAATRRDLVRHARIPIEKIRVVPLGRDEKLRPVTDASALTAVRTRYGLPERFALYMGAFDNRKDVPLLFRAVERAGGDWPLAVIGVPPPPSLPLYPDVKAAAVPLGDRVRWLGRISEEDKAVLLSAATVFVHPSRYEGFGLPPLEAMACGTPVICADAASVVEITEDNALVYPAGDEQALADGLHRLMNDDQLRLEYRARGLARASIFTWERTARVTRELYLQALSS